jgi:hypothetical protein
MAARNGIHQRTMAGLAVPRAQGIRAQRGQAQGSSGGGGGFEHHQASRPAREARGGSLQEHSDPGPPMSCLLGRLSPAGRRHAVWMTRVSLSL